MTITVPLISVVIPTYGTAGVMLTETCISTMIAAHPAMGIQIIVVDDCSRQDAVDEVEQLCDIQKAEFVKLPERSGFAKACNAGIRRANGLTVFLVNNDIEFVLGHPALQILANTLVATPNSGVVGTRLLYPDGKVQHGGVAFVPTPNGEVPGYFDHMCRGQEPTSYEAVQLRRCLVTGALFGISRQALGMVGLLDERYGMAVEDIDYSLDVLMAGLTVMYNGYTHAIHHEGATRGATPEEKFKRAPDMYFKELGALRKLFAKFPGTNWMNFSGGLK